MLHKAALCGALACLLIALAWACSQRPALADTSASFDRSATADGIQQKLAGSISLSEFNAEQMGYQVFNAMRDPR